MISQLNLQNKIWTRVASDDQEIETRIELFQHTAETFQKPYCFLPGNDALHVEKRIGSDSVNAVVYLLTTSGGGELAGKVMPIISAKSETENKNEIDIAQNASRVVMSGLSSHFPMVYGTAHCGRVDYDVNSPFIEASYNYFLYKKMEDSLGRKGAIRFKQETHGMTIEKKKEYVHEKIPVADLSDIHASADVLLSELAWGDLDTFLAKKKELLTVQTLIEMSSVIIDVITDMQRYLHIVHDDFHTGNILLVFNIYGADLLAHDFGTARPLQDDDFLQDISYITTKLTDRHFTSGEFGQLLGRMYEYIEKHSGDRKTTMEDLRTYWFNIM